MVFAIGGMPLTLGLRCNACGTTYWPDEDILEKLAARAQRAQLNKTASSTKEKPIRAFLNFFSKIFKVIHKSCIF